MTRHHAEGGGDPQCYSSDVPYAHPRGHRSRRASVTGAFPGHRCRREQRPFRRPFRGDGIVTRCLHKNTQMVVLCLPPPPPQRVVKQDTSSGGSVDTTKTRSGPQRVRMSSGERPIGAAKGRQADTEALCHPPPPPKSPPPPPSHTCPALTWHPAPCHREVLASELGRHREGRRRGLCARCAMPWPGRPGDVGQRFAAGLWALGPSSLSDWVRAGCLIQGEPGRATRVRVQAWVVSTNCRLSFRGGWYLGG